MSKIDDGGPAFPIWQPDMNLGDTAGPGITMRDYFAAQAISALPIRNWDGEGFKDDLEMVNAWAEAAYAVADAMLKARATGRRAMSDLLDDMAECLGWAAPLLRTWLEDPDTERAMAELNLTTGGWPDRCDAVLIRYRAHKADAQGERDELVGALSALEKAEHDYRLVCQSQGSDHIETGRSWDRMRRAGDAARTALANAKKAEGS